MDHRKIPLQWTIDSTICYSWYQLMVLVIFYPLEKQAVLKTIYSAKYLSEVVQCKDRIK